jgi:hypothetical protein
MAVLARGSIYWENNLVRWQASETTALFGRYMANQRGYTKHLKG